MTITAEINDYSNPSHPRMRIHNHWCDGDKVEIEVDGKRYIVKGSEIISAIQKCMLNSFGE